jgi:hypothetical protein
VWELRSRAQAQSNSFCVGDILLVLGECASASAGCSPEARELETHSRAFICNCSHCSVRPFRRGSYGRRGDVGAVMGVGI